MQVLTKKRLREFATAYPETAEEVFDLYTSMVEAQWETPADVKAFDRTADYVGGDRWVFNIRRNRYRLVVRIFFPAKQVYIRFIGTHAEYDRIPDITKV